MSKTNQRIVLATWGSLGDLHPYLAIALELKSRGHQPVIATCSYYREKVESLGIEFHSARPDLPDFENDESLIRRFMDRRHGPRRILRELLLPSVRDSYTDLLAITDRADLLVSHFGLFAAPLVAEQTGIAWIPTALAPAAFLSVYDPPVLPPLPSLDKLRRFGPTLFRPLRRFVRCAVRRWSRDWHVLRQEIGLPSTRLDPLLDWSHSAPTVLAMFSEQLGRKQADWPEPSIVTGFPFYDQDGDDTGLPTGLSEFLDAGSPPIVFTLGSAAVMDAGSFFEQSAAAAQRLDRRAVLLTGPQPENRPADLPDTIVAFDYAPYSELFPRAAVNVHQGGVGTTGQAMRAGRPTLVMPYSHDQPDNAARVRRLGISRTIDRNRYTAQRAAAELSKLLNNPSYEQRAAEIGQQMQKEDGVKTVCDALLATLNRS